MQRLVQQDTLYVLFEDAIKHLISRHEMFSKGTKTHLVNQEASMDIILVGQFAEDDSQYCSVLNCLRCTLIF